MSIVCLECGWKTECEICEPFCICCFTGHAHKDKDKKCFGACKPAKERERATQENVRKQGGESNGNQD